MVKDYAIMSTAKEKDVLKFYFSMKGFKLLRNSTFDENINVEHVHIELYLDVLKNGKFIVDEAYLIPDYQSVLSVILSRRGIMYKCNSEWHKYNNIDSLNNTKKIFKEIIKVGLDLLHFYREKQYIDNISNGKKK